MLLIYSTLANIASSITGAATTPNVLVYVSRRLKIYAYRKPKRLALNSYVLAANAGSFTLSGAAAGFAVVEGAQAGSYSLGYPASGTADLAVTMGGAAGSYTLNGAAASLTYA